MARAIGKLLLGVFDNEEKLLQATRSVREAGAKVVDVYTPYPVHGIDEAAGIRRSRLGIVTFLAGLTGFSLAMGFEIWSMAVDWPLNVGGKPLLSIPAFVPVSFELTVLIGGLSTVLALLIRTKLFPGKRPLVIDSRVTHDRFVLALEDGDGRDLEKIKGLLSAAGAVEVRASEGAV